MYSVVLAAMLTAGTATTPAWHHASCHGCCGYSSCHGCCGYSSCHGCHGYSSCHGCCGYSSCHGCCGYSCGGCYGAYAGYAYGGYGCYGAYAYYGCSGCFGVFGCGGGYSGGVASFSGSAPYRGGIVSAPGDNLGTALAEAPNAQPASVITQDQAQQAAVASRVTVKLPADAKLYVNNDPCPLTSTTRSFETPKLNADQDYTYTIKVQVNRNGQTITESKKVVFKAGDPVTVNFNDVGTVRTAQK